MRRPRVSDLGAALLATLLGAGCHGSLNPIVANQSSDGATSIDALVPPCPDQLIGFATMSDLGGEWDAGLADAGPTLLLSGGVAVSDLLGAGNLVVVDAEESDALLEFTTYASDKTPGPLTIVVKGMIAVPPPPDGGDPDVQKIRVSANKAVIGANPMRSGFTGGGLSLKGVSNVILRNLVIAKPNSDDSGNNVDAIHVEGSSQIWIDHCDLSSGVDISGGAASGAPSPSYDGLVDISDGSDFVTVSWTHYHDHADTGLVGRSDTSDAAAQDAEKEHVTYDHDWFSDVATGPRARFGTVHVLNAYFDQVANYAVAAIDGATVRIENSAFVEVTPIQTDPDFGPVTTSLSGDLGPGYVDLENNLPAAMATDLITTPPVTLSLPYSYASSTDLPSSVQPVLARCAGVGIVTVPATN